ncbi:MAG: iron-sulfur cluster assembly scaffold protein [Candidatus Woesearchaeota archaeon]|nr:iron-sulfur cluster assembly scaffold protein [Candidatus Woesearchaeota archaeon]
MEATLARELYQEHIIDLFKHPHNFGMLQEATHCHTENNPLCGDEVTMQVVMKNEKIENVRFTGHGCAISTASASLVTDKVKGMSKTDVVKMTTGDVLEMLMIPIGPVRLKCALLALETIQKTVQM